MTTEEEFFSKTYPDACYGDTPLSPYWDFFQDGVDFGEQQSEKRIKELEAQIEKMKCCQNCKNEGDYKEPYRYGTCWCNICIRHKVAKGNFDKWEIKEND